MGGGISISQTMAARELRKKLFENPSETVWEMTYHEIMSDKFSGVIAILRFFKRQNIDKKKQEV